MTCYLILCFKNLRTVKWHAPVSVEVFLETSIGSYDGTLSFRFVHVLSRCRLTMGYDRTKGKMETIFILCPREG